MAFNVDEYFYGAYVKFILNNSGGGGGGENIPASAQTGDWIGILIIALLALAVIAAGVAFMFRNFEGLKKLLPSHFSIKGSIASAISNKKILTVALIAICSLLIVGIAMSAKAFAKDVTPGNHAAPAYTVASASMDQDNGIIEISPVHLVDDYVVEGVSHPCYAGISGFRIQTLNGINAQDLGTWTVYMDGIKVYEGPAQTSFDWSYVTKEKGCCDIDIQVRDISKDKFDFLNEKTAVAVEFQLNKLFSNELPGELNAKVDLKYGQSQLQPKDETAFNKFMCAEKGWEIESGNYSKNFPFYTSFDEILSDWYYAVDNDMFTEGSVANFYKWKPNWNTSFSSMLIDNEEFYPYWYVGEKNIDFTYKIDANIGTTAKWEEVKAKYGWELQIQEALDTQEPTYKVVGQISNHFDIDELNAILSDGCFTFSDCTFNGFEKKRGMIFEEIGDGDSFDNSAVLQPIYVCLGGMVVNEAGVGMPNVGVCFVPKGYIWNAREDNRQGTSSGVPSTITDSNGNYVLPCPKGWTGVLYIGGTFFSSTNNEVVGDSFLLDKVREKAIPTVVVKQKVTLSATVYFPESGSNKAKLDSGMVKFVTTDSQGNQQVFYEEGFNNKNIETYSNIEGKLIYESALYYGETELFNTGTSASSHEINCQLKTNPDCVVKGKITLTDVNGDVQPLADKDVFLLCNDPTGKPDNSVEIKVHTDAQGYYVLNSFQNLYVKQVTYYEDPDTKEVVIATMHYDAIMFFGDLYNFNINLVESDTVLVPDDYTEDLV